MPDPSSLWGRMPSIAEFVDRSEPMAQGTTGDAVYERFQAEPSTLVIAVVDPQGRPVGIVERNTFFLHMASHYGRALYARRPIDGLMNRNPPVFTRETRVPDLFQQVDESTFGSLLRGFLVVHDGEYVGVGTAAHILRAGYALNRQRADEMTRLAEDLAWAESEAMASSRAKSRFLAVMSHEIRTPLNGVLGVAELMDLKLAEGNADSHVLRPYVRTILDSGQGLLRLLTDALEISRAEAGALDLDARPFDVRDLCTDLDALWRPVAEQKGLTLAVSCDAAEEHVFARGDATRLKQVFNNLIGNALKFTEAGAVGVSVAVAPQGGRLRFSARVNDTGPGVPRDQAARVFEPFAIGEAGATGAGLGLSICRQLVELMDGRIWLDAEAPIGAAFAFEVTLEAAEAEDLVQLAPAEPGTAHQTLHVLVVDDNPTNRFVACKLLETFGCTAETAENGEQAVEAVRRGRFDLVLMDIKMPVLGGVEATRLIRTLASPVAEVPVIALTANADPDDARGYLAAGMCEVVQKPIRPDLLLNALRRSLNRSAEPVRTAA